MTEQLVYFLHGRCQLVDQFRFLVDHGFHLATLRIYLTVLCFNKAQELYVVPLELRNLSLVRRNLCISENLTELFWAAFALPRSMGSDAQLHLLALICDRLVVQALHVLQLQRALLEIKL